MHIVMVGAGYVGLVSGACFADFGHSVTCVDKDANKIEALRRGEMPIFEPGLEHLVASNVKAGRLAVATDLRDPVREAVPVGEGDEVERIIRETRPEGDFSVVSNPEFLREGAAISDFKRPDRIVIGAEDERAKSVMTELYRPLYLNQAPLLFTSRRTAELTKYAANAFLATKISFINEIADLCEKTGANVQDVARGIGLDNRIGSKFLHAGPGYGGSCFPKDTLALVRTAADAPVRLVETTVQINDARKKAMAGKIARTMGGELKGKTIGVLGLTFKPN